MVEKIMKPGLPPPNGVPVNTHDIYESSQGGQNMPMGPPQPQPHHGPGNGVVMGHPGSGVVINDVSHPLSSANPPGLPRPPLHPAMSHTHGHSHLIAPGGGATLQHNGSPMQRITHSGKNNFEFEFLYSYFVNCFECPLNVMSLMSF